MGCITIPQNHVTRDHNCDCCFFAFSLNIFNAFPCSRFIKHFSTRHESKFDHTFKLFAKCNFHTVGLFVELEEVSYNCCSVVVKIKIIILIMLLPNLYSHTLLWIIVHIYTLFI